jgi:outer membrane lipoprotein-sorting protein
MRFVCPALLPILFLTTCAAADQLQQTLAKMDEAAASFKGLTADMKRVDYTFVIKEEDQSSGTIVVRRPKPKEMQMRMDIKEPDPQQISFLGRTAEQYNPKTNIDQIVDDVDKKYGAVVNQYLLLGFGASSKDLQQVYTIAFGGPETIGDQKTTKIELTPKKPDTAFHLIKADLWISDQTGIAIQQQLHYLGGDYKLATYSNMKINPNIPESAVKLNLPANVKREYPLK